MPTAAEIAKLEEIRQKQAWASEYSDELLLTTIKKYPDLFEIEDVNFFEWGADPVTAWVGSPGFNFLLLGAAALIFLFIWRR